MTAREAGIRLGRLSKTQKNPARTNSTRRPEKLSTRERRRLFQLLFCGSVFLLLVAWKLLIPSSLAQLRAPLQHLLEQNMNVTEVFSSVGRAISGEQSVESALSEVYRAVFLPDAGASFAAAGAAPSLQSMSAYAHHTGPVSGWLPASAQAEAAESAPVDVSAPADTAAISSNGLNPPTAALHLSSVLYSGENLPACVNLEQAVLGFDYCTPVSGTLSSPFGYREHPLEGEDRFHYGVDLAADNGAAISCFADGTVTAVGESSSYGNYVTVSHAGGYSTLYAHCSAICVSSGAEVKRGETIAKVGETGLATGPHLHFELHNDGMFFNPIYYVAPL